jgi:hypothetical protein
MSAAFRPARTAWARRGIADRRAVCRHHCRRPAPAGERAQRSAIRVRSVRVDPRSLDGLYAREPLRELIQRLAELWLDHRLCEELLHVMQSQRRVSIERGFQPSGIALEPGPSRAAPGQAAGGKQVDARAVSELGASRSCPPRSAVLREEAPRAARFPDQTGRVAPIQISRCDPTNASKTPTA